jgi:hypothetical protein
MSNTLTRFGNSALANNTTGFNNSAFGHFAAYNNTDASCNTAIGACSSFYNVHGEHNTAIGAGSMCNNVGGNLNTAVGSSALEGPFPSGNVGNQNVAIGAQALYSNYGNQNVGVGCYALIDNTSGYNNTAVGYQALYSNTDGSNNTALGYQALNKNTTGIFNVALGAGPLFNNQTGSWNIALGDSALNGNTTGSNNIALGLEALNGNNGSSNVAIGSFALLNNSTGSSNVAIGQNSLLYNRIGGDNTAIGVSAGGTDLSGNSNFNTFLGAFSDVSSNLLAYNNSTALGYQATIDASNQIVLGGQNASGAYPSVYIPGSYVGIGTYNPGNGFTLDVSGNLNTTMDASINSITVGRGGGNAQSNTAVGFEALQANTTLNSGGYENTAVGYLALQVNIDGIGNTAIGWAALDSNVGVSNTAIGSGAGSNDVSGNFNTFLGGSTDVYNSTLTYNNSTALGYSAIIDASNQIVLGGQNASGAYPSVYIPGSYVGIGGVYNPSSGYALDVSGALQTTMDASINSITVGLGGGNVSTNTALGFSALVNNNTTNGLNTATGYNSLPSNTSGQQNTATGAQSLFINQLGTENTAVGVSALYNSINSQNTAIGVNAGYNLTSGSNNTFVGFNAEPSSASVSHEITLGDGNVLTVLRCAATTITSTSDARDKKDIEPLASGLQFVDQLKPVKFVWNMRDGQKVNIPAMGFIAQDLKQVQKDTGITVPNLVYESNPDKLEASYGTLLPILVKAVQELSAKVTILETELSELKK